MRESADRPARPRPSRALPFFFSLLGVLFLGRPAQAGGPVILTLKDAMAVALKNHPRVLAAESEMASAREQVREARSAYLPTMKAFVTGSAANQPSRIGAGFLPASQLFNRFGQGLALSQLVTDLGRTENLVATSWAQSEATAESSKATRAAVLLAVNRAYFEVLRAQGLRRVAEETVTARQGLNDQVTTLAQNKLRSQLDVSFTEVGVSEAKLMVIRAQDQLDAAYAELARSLGSEDQTLYTLEDEPLPNPPPATPDELVAEAIRNRPELASARFAREAAYRFESAERDLSRPSVVLLGVAGYIPYIEQNPGTRIPSHYEAAALNIEIPVFNGHLFSARRAVAREQARVGDQYVRDLQEHVVRDVHVAWGAALTAFQRLDVTAHLLQQATLGLDLAHGRYELGLSSIVELTQAQLNLTQAEVENLSAKYDYESQYAQLEYSIGAMR
jgi:outer membrane protein